MAESTTPNRINISVIAINILFVILKHKQRQLAAHSRTVLLAPIFKTASKFSHVVAD